MRANVNFIRLWPSQFQPNKIILLEKADHNRDRPHVISVSVFTLLLRYLHWSAAVSSAGSCAVRCSGICSRLGCVSASAPVSAFSAAAPSDRVRCFCIRAVCALITSRRLVRCLCLVASIGCLLGAQINGLVGGDGERCIEGKPSSIPSR